MGDKTNNTNNIGDLCEFRKFSRNEKPDGFAGKLERSNKNKQNDIYEGTKLICDP